MKNDNKSPTYIIEDKLDGVSCLLSSENGTIKLFTRGNGYEGTDITHILKHINDIPKNYQI